MSFWSPRSVREREAEDFAHDGTGEDARFLALVLLEVNVGDEDEDCAHVSLNIPSEGVGELVTNEVEELLVLDD